MVENIFHQKRWKNFSIKNDGKYFPVENVFRKADEFSLREKDFIFEGTDCLLCEVGDHHPRFLEGEVHRCPNFFKALIIVIISWRSSHFVAVN